jgi:uncharacterized protein (TIGR02145 family)
MNYWSILFLITFNFYTLNAFSQVSTATITQKKMALIIGNGNYNSSTLSNPENDARAMEKVLKRLGFVVYKYENLNQGQMKRAIDEFGSKLKKNDVGLFYYAGHGIQSNGYNFLIPTDAQLMTEKQVEYDCVQADRVLAIMEGSGTTINIIILDACRNNPFERSWTRSSTGRGLAFMNAPGGTFIAYSTAPGSTASDGSGNNSPYTSAILESIETPNITITQMFQNVTRILSQKTARQQVPWISSSLTGDFYFNTSETVMSNIPNEKKVADTGDKNKTSSESSNSLKENVNSISSKVDSNKVVSNYTLNAENLKKEVIDPLNALKIEYIVDNRDNQQYKTIKIGNQVWMAENLKTTKLIDGTPIPVVPERNSWSSAINIACCWYNNDESLYNSVYGVLYNWHTVATGKLCPKNWHVPTDSEWSTLIIYLGGLDLSGGKLKEAGLSHWITPNANATNQSRFSALPGGTRFKNGSYDFVGFLGTWWSSTEQSPDFAFYRGVYYNYGVVHKNYENKNAGFSVRCIRDEIKGTN